MKYTMILRMCCILIFLCIQCVKLALVTFTYYYEDDLFAGMLCLSSAAKLTGIFPVLTKCAVKCKRTDGCLSFFYDEIGLECYSVTTVLTSRTGVCVKPGSSYYIRLVSVDSDCYTFTQEDYSKMDQPSVSYETQCESYPFHVYTKGNNRAYSGCGECWCCQLKGCTNGASSDYNGTWSQTRYGRKCQRWDSQTPHENDILTSDGYKFPNEESLYDAHNYCRNPDVEPYGVWCYTNDPYVRWEYCGIPAC